MEVAWVPLRNDVRRRFNSTLASQFFTDNKGAPYSHRANFFSVVDTVEDNYLFASELVPFMVRYAQMLYPKKVFEGVFKEALNKRIGIHDEGKYYHTFEDLLVAAVSDKNVSIEELMAIPEQDSWRYSNQSGDGPIDFAASTFVTAFYRAAGLFEAKIVREINVQEFTVKDLYELDFYNTTA